MKRILFISAVLLAVAVNYAHADHRLNLYISGQAPLSTMDVVSEADVEPAGGLNTLLRGTISLKNRYELGVQARQEAGDRSYQDIALYGRADLLGADSTSTMKTYIAVTVGSLMRDTQGEMPDAEPFNLELMFGEELVTDGAFNFFAEFCYRSAEDMDASYALDAGVIRRFH